MALASQSWQSVGMAATDLQRLAAHVKRRRLQLNLSMLRAAEVADVSKDTWKRVEIGLPVRHLTYDRIEAALRWSIGSCRKVADGGDEVLIDPPQSPTIRLTSMPPEDLEVEIRDAVQGALVATTDDLTAAQIRAINQRAIEFLRARGVLPPAEQ